VGFTKDHSNPILLNDSTMIKQKVAGT